MDIFANTRLFRHFFAHGSVSHEAELPFSLWVFSYQMALAAVAAIIILRFFGRSTKPKTMPGLGSAERDMREKTGAIHGVSKHASQTSIRFRWGGTYTEILTDIVRAAAGFVLRLISLALFFAVFYAAIFEETGAGVTIAPVAVFISLWAGLGFLSVAFGDVWRHLSPWDSLLGLAEAIKKAVGRKAGQAAKNAWRTPPPTHISSYLAVVCLAAFVWFELIHPSPHNTRLLGSVILVYTLYMLTGGFLWGRKWMQQADFLAVLSRLFGGISITGLASLGLKKIRKRPPSRSAAENPKMNAGLTYFLWIIIGATLYDAVSTQSWWREIQSSQGWSGVPLASAGLVAGIAAVAGVFLVFSFPVWRLERHQASFWGFTFSFGYVLTPMAAAYWVANYFSLLLFEGQNFAAALSDPFGRGWDIFSTAHFQPETLLSDQTTSWIQALVLAAGTITALVLANRVLIRNLGFYITAAMMLVFGITGVYLFLNH